MFTKSYDSYQRVSDNFHLCLILFFYLNRRVDLLVFGKTCLFFISFNARPNKIRYSALIATIMCRRLLFRFTELPNEKKNKYPCRHFFIEYKGDTAITTVLLIFLLFFLLFFLLLPLLCLCLLFLFGVATTAQYFQNWNCVACFFFAKLACQSLPVDPVVIRKFAKCSTKHNRRMVPKRANFNQ